MLLASCMVVMLWCWQKSVHRRISTFQNTQNRIYERHNQHILPCRYTQRDSQTEIIISWHHCSWLFASFTDCVIYKLNLKCMSDEFVHYVVYFRAITLMLMNDPFAHPSDVWWWLKYYIIMVYRYTCGCSTINSNSVLLCVMTAALIYWNTGGYTALRLLTVVKWAQVLICKRM